ncbi:hypothetical protein K2173_027064 [Erythroxylum novogranatense]|uniref:Uncharacterized protein n=1 Tax=Erythroxylum novogranatense TaxID=1862640 RepID=A0AAV8TYA8_9ROSI|nr:hypothetical protein K2173_027064 [Erythroxylum novogranatense]
MAVAPPTSWPVTLRSHQNQFLSSNNPHLHRLFSPKQPLTIVAMAPKKKVNKYDEGWKKSWYGAGIFYEASEEVEFDVFKKLEKRKVLSNVEKAGLLSKAEELGVTLSSIEKLGLFSKAEELGLLSLLEKLATVSPSTLASAALPIFVAALAAIVVIPDDSAGLVVVQAVIAGALVVGAAGLFVGSVVLGGIQEAD